MGRPSDQRMWAFIAHLAILLDIPLILLFQGLWPFTFHPVTLVPIAPIISYMVYSRNRRVEERQWLAFHALQAMFLQMVLIIIVFVVPFAYFAAFIAIFAIFAALVFYGLVGAVAAYIGRDFKYIGLGQMAERIVRRRFEGPQ